MRIISARQSERVQNFADGPGYLPGSISVDQPSFFSESAAARSLNNYDVIDVHFGRSYVAHRLDAPVSSFDPITPYFAGFAACHSERRNRPVIRQYRCRHRLQKPHAARAAVAAAPASGTA